MYCVFNDNISLRKETTLDCETYRKTLIRVRSLYCYKKEKKKKKRKETQQLFKYGRRILQQQQKMHMYN